MFWGLINFKPYGFGGYSYDFSGRLTKAEFNRYEPPSGTVGYTWRHDLTDYTTSNITYDRDGNIATMDQKGVKPGTGIVTMDQLQYGYESNSDRLQKVVDNASFYDLGDFNNTNGTSNDYTYDANGNLTADANKGIRALRIPISTNRRWLRSPAVRVSYTAMMPPAAKCRSS